MADVFLLFFFQVLISDKEEHCNREYSFALNRAHRHLSFIMSGAYNLHSAGSNGEIGENKAIRWSRIEIQRM